MSTHFTHGYALLIGVGKMKQPQWSLPATVADMKALYDILIDPRICAYPADNNHVRLLHDEKATRHAILDGLIWLQNCADSDPDATVVIFFSGHGMVDHNALQYYLIPHDYDAEQREETALNAFIITEMIRKINARRLLVIIDSCRAEAMVMTKDQSNPNHEDDIVIRTPPDNIINRLKQGEGRAVFTSSRGTQPSFIRNDNKMSIYTYHLIEALEGAGNRVGDTEVRLSNIQSYVSKRVPETALQQSGTEQTPFFDIAAEDFPIALLHGGKGLPVGGWAKIYDSVQAKLHSVSDAYHRNVVINVNGNSNVVADNIKNSMIVSGNRNHIKNR